MERGKIIQSSLNLKNVLKQKYKNKIKKSYKI